MKSLLFCLSLFLFGVAYPGEFVTPINPKVAAAQRLQFAERQLHLALNPITSVPTAPFVLAELQNRVDQARQAYEQFNQVPGGHRFNNPAVKRKLRFG